MAFLWMQRIYVISTWHITRTSESRNAIAVKYAIEKKNKLENHNISERKPTKKTADKHFMSNE